jgi:large subunit ribosomal protein L15
MAIELNNLKPAVGSRNKFKRFGRGNASGRGTTAGKGTKGQRARQGGRKGLRQIGMKRTVQSTPKLGGFSSLAKRTCALPVLSLNKFANGSIVTVAALVKIDLVPAWCRHVKIVGNEKISRKLTLKGIAASEGAKKQIEAAGGMLVA